MESNRLPIRLYSSGRTTDAAVGVASRKRFKIMILTCDLKSGPVLALSGLAFAWLSLRARLAVGPIESESLLRLCGRGHHTYCGPNGEPRMLSLALASPPVHNRGRPSSREFR